ncbi:hypothetical protein A0J61_10264 [Choanephora cucurbitarum]|uniref:Reverse transcriptase zinc-binding domain-containing protein n=1 Tax=Choanephora cucurbitarum TaxID=101091 RepID=A0A1C7MXV8_9FUNG|nr:hypothetical protein A0J61_10264 [Choanephora cucurbitarum]
MKWLRSLSSGSSSFSQEILFRHFALMSPCKKEPLFTFYSLDHRIHALIHPTSFIPSLYKAFDHFGIAFSFDQVPTSVLLHFPLWRFFESIPTDHWLQRYKTLPAPQLLESTLGSLLLSIRRPGSYSCLPNFLYRLYLEVVAEGSMCFSTLVSPWIAFRPPTLLPLPNSDALRNQLITSDLWQIFSSKSFRLHRSASAPSHRIRISSRLLTHFWTLPVYLPVRTLGCRTFCKHLPTNQRLCQIDIRSSAHCQLCRQEDTHNHFFAACPVR